MDKIPKIPQSNPDLSAGLHPVNERDPRKIEIAPSSEITKKGVFNKKTVSTWANKAIKYLESKLSHSSKKRKTLRNRVIVPACLKKLQSIRRNQGKWSSTISQGALNDLRIRNLTIAIDMINQFQNEASNQQNHHNNPSNKSTTASLNLLCIDLQSELDYLQEERNNNHHQLQQPVTDNKDIKEIKKHPAILQKRMHKAGIPIRGLHQQFRTKTINLINKKQWQPITTEIETTSSGTLVCQQTPASHIKPNATCDSDIFPESYHGEGVCSATTASDKHAANLWTSSLKTQKGAILYQGVRHGTLSAYGIKAPSDRKTATENHVKESLLAAITLKPDLLQQALSNPDNPVTINLTSTQLVTPAPFYKERKMLTEQMDAFRTITEKQPIKLDIKAPDGSIKTISVIAKTACFNFGVNGIAVNRSTSLAIGGWGLSDSYNAKALRELTGYEKPHQGFNGKTKPKMGWHGRYCKNTKNLGGWVESYLKRQEQIMANKYSLLAELTKDSIEEQKKIGQDIATIRQQIKIVEQLATQINTIYKKKSHHYEYGDPYKAPARILLLTHLINGVPLSNCKSGKDRTGMLDAEVKLLAARIERDGEVPEPGPLTLNRDKELFQNILLNSGNFEVQEYNTGMAGYMTERVKSIDERIGNDLIRKEVRGGSGAVRS